MSNEIDNNDLEIGEDSFDDFEKKPKTLGDLWRDNPMIKIGAVVLAAIVVFSGIMMMGGKKEDPNISSVAQGSDVSAPPGTEQANPAYIAAVEEENQARLDQAQREGGSALPTAITPPTERLTVPEEELSSEDPLERWRQLQEEKTARELETPFIDPAQPNGISAQEVARNEAVQAMSGVMSQQMQSILESKSENTVQSLQITDPGFLNQGLNGQNVNGSNQVSGQGGISEDGFFEDDSLENFQNVLLPAGEIFYAQLLTEANSDVPGPILAELMSGPLKGSRLIGSFTAAEELLILNFNTIVVDGVSLSINAIAIDPENTLTAMATDVDRHYFKKIFLPMAAAFVEGAAEAISESGRTSVTITGETVAESQNDTSNEQEVASGIEEAGSEFREILEDMADVETTVIVRTGAPMGILFLEPVVDNQTASSQAANFPTLPVAPAAAPSTQ